MTKCRFIWHFISILQYYFIGGRNLCGRYTNAVLLQGSKKAIQR